MRYPNFYECMQEAQARLFRTVVLYDGNPYHVTSITDHKGDDIFRVYLTPIEIVDSPEIIPFLEIAANHNGMPDCGNRLDEWLDQNPDSGILRKHMNSPKFNRFRPFPLGMCSVGTRTYYVERQPTRPRMEQGLTKSSLYETLVTAGRRSDSPTMIPQSLDLFSTSFKNCIIGDHHCFSVAIEALLNPKIANDSIPFHREFALVKGPMEMLFLGYRTEIIGVLPFNDARELRLGKEFRFCREVIGELDVFDTVK